MPAGILAAPSDVGSTDGVRDVLEPKSYATMPTTVPTTMPTTMLPTMPTYYHAY